MKKNVSKSKTFPVLKLISSLVIGTLLIFTITCKKDNDSPPESEIVKNKITSTLDSVLANTHVPGMVAGIWAPNEDTLSKYLPDFPRADEVTIEMLCNMRSGIYNYSGANSCMVV